MFRSIQERFAKRLENIKSKTSSQNELDKNIRSFLIKEFGPIGESLSFKASQENRKVYIRLQSKVAANEVILRSGKLREILRSYNNKIEVVNID